MYDTYTVWRDQAPTQNCCSARTKCCHQSDLCCRPQTETLLCARCLLGAQHLLQPCCKLSSLPAGLCIVSSITRDKMKNGPSNFPSFSFLVHASYGYYDYYFWLLFLATASVKFTIPRFPARINQFVAMEVKCTITTKKKFDFTQHKCTFPTPLSPLASSC